MRKFLLSVACAALLVLGVSSAAAAATDSDSYAPSPPVTPSLSGSSVSPACSADVPWITYSVALNNPSNVATGHTARLVLSNGSDSVTIPLGELVDGRLLSLIHI